jgi:hypothetical protein
VKKLVERLRERAISYRQSGPSAEHTARLLDEAADRLESLDERLNCERMHNTILTDDLRVERKRVAQAEQDLRVAREAIALYEAGVNALQKVWFDGIDVDKSKVTSACLGLFATANKARSLSNRKDGEADQGIERAQSPSGGHNDRPRSVTGGAAPDDEESYYEIGKRVGYEEAVQEIDVATGGDGEFYGSTLPGRGVDAAAMKQRIVDRCAAWRAVENLRMAEGNSVTLLNDNPDGEPNSAVDCCGEWTEWVPRRFVGNCVEEALRNANNAMMATPPGGGDKNLGMAMPFQFEQGHWPLKLHPATANLVLRFASALAWKLLRSQEKYGYVDNWARTSWAEEARRHLRDHHEKGDPLDVAAYCAFMWHHGWSTR